MHEVLMFVMTTILILSRTVSAIFYSIICIIFYYLFLSNIPVTVFGIDDFLRYTKEPMLMIILTKSLFHLFKIKNVFSYATTLPIVQTDNTYERNLYQKKLSYLRVALFALILMSFMSLFHTGVTGLFGYFRGIVLPSSFFFLLLSIQDSHLESFVKKLGNMSSIFLVLLLILAIIHMFVNQDFMIPDAFKNRLDASQAYTSIIQYGDVKRYQSFFGDPNRLSLVVLLLYWFGWPFRKTLGRILLTLSVVYILLISESRSALILLFLWIAWVFFDKVRSKAAVIFILFSVLVFIAIFWYEFSSRSGVTINIGRGALWSSVATYLLNSPFTLLFGNGFNSIGQQGYGYMLIEGLHVTASDGTSIALNVIDNSYLSLVLFIGLFGTIILLFFYSRLIYLMQPITSSKRHIYYYWVIVVLLSVWCFVFDALISFPWTILFPLLIRMYAIKNLRI